MLIIYTMHYPQMTFIRSKLTIFFCKNHIYNIKLQKHYFLIIVLLFQVFNLKYL